jgi:DNA-binding NarL/FixJ family response regulator
MIPFRVAVALSSIETRQSVLNSLKSGEEFDLIAEINTLEETLKLVQESQLDLILVEMQLDNGRPSPGLPILLFADRQVIVVGVRRLANRSLNLFTSESESINVAQNDFQNDFPCALLALTSELIRDDLNGDNEPVSLDDSLTNKEMEVLELLSQGADSCQIAASLSITVSTVHFHVGNILKKLKAANRTEAVVKAAQKGILEI